MRDDKFHGYLAPEPAARVKMMPRQNAAPTNMSAVAYGATVCVDGGATNQSLTMVMKPRMDNAKEVKIL